MASPTPGSGSPFMDSLVQNELGPKPPGSPSTAGKAGGVQAGRPFAFPNPPSPDKSQPGRPSTSTGPVPGVAPPPSSPVTPGTGSSQPIEGAEAVPQQAESAQKAEQVTEGAVDPVTGQLLDAGGGVTGPPQVNMSRMPRPGEVPPGTVVQTPFGTVEDTGDGSSKLALSPEGTAKYKAAKAGLRKKLGAMPSNLSKPGMPDFPVELGQYNYNPFTGSMERD